MILFCKPWEERAGMEKVYWQLCSTTGTSVHKYGLFCSDVPCSQSDWNLGQHKTSSFSPACSAVWLHFPGECSSPLGIILTLVLSTWRCLQGATRGTGLASGLDAVQGNTGCPLKALVHPLEADQPCRLMSYKSWCSCWNSLGIPLKAILLGIKYF